MTSPIRISFIAASSAHAAAASAAASHRAASASPFPSEEDDLAQLDAALKNLGIRSSDDQGSGADSSDERLSRFSEHPSGSDSSDGFLSRAGEERCSTGIVLDPRFQQFDQTYLQLIRRGSSRRSLIERPASSSIKRTLEGQGDDARGQTSICENSEDQANCGLRLEAKRVQMIPSVVPLHPTQGAQQGNAS